MKPDSEVKHDVESELQWSPEIDAGDIAVKVNDSVVTLSGFAKSFSEKLEAENAAKRVSGVRGVANDLQIRSHADNALTDPEIARAAVYAISTALPAVADSLKVLVHYGRVTLEGNTQWHFLRERAETVVRWLPGVTGVTNAIVVQPHAAPEEIRTKIQEAFRRNAEVDGNAISVEATGSVVTLLGKVRSWSEREEAQRTAWAAPGVTQVTSNIVVSS